MKKPIGHYVIGGVTKIGLLKKPNKFHRIISRFLLGWSWEDAGDNPNKCWLEFL